MVWISGENSVFDAQTAHAMAWGQLARGSHPGSALPSSSAQNK